MSLSEQHEQLSRDWRERAVDALNRWATQEATTAGATRNSTWIRKDFTIAQTGDPFAQVTVTKITDQMETHDDAPPTPVVEITWCPTEYLNRGNDSHWSWAAPLSEFVSTYRPLVEVKS